MQADQNGNNRLSRIIVAYGSVPKDGGTFTFYRNLRESLLDHGIDLRCVSVGKSDSRLWDSSFADDGCVLLAKSESSIKKQAQVFVQWCQDIGVDIVFGVNSSAILSALPHLPAQIKIMSRCANAFDHGYRITMSCYERISRIVALAPRQVKDLVDFYGADEHRIVLIPNGTSTDRFVAAAGTLRGTKKPLRLGFLGRLEHKQKGVFFIPEILNGLHKNHVDFSLTIAGKGVHEATLRRKLKSFIETGTVSFVGALKPEEIAEYFTNIDVYLFPSQFEGSPNALIEAMMAGCVPIAWKLEGITDFVIEDGSTGMLAGLGDCDTLVESITKLANNREHLQTMSKNVSVSARMRFPVERVVSDYVVLFSQVQKEFPKSWKVRDWEDFKVDPAFEQEIWKSLLPRPLKNLLKKVLRQLGAHN